MVVTYGVDNQTSRSIFKALASGTVADGPMTLVLERAKDPKERTNWKPEEIPAESVTKRGGKETNIRRRWILDGKCNVCSVIFRIYIALISRL